MADSIGTVLSKGWADLKANPVLLAPCVFSIVITYIVLFAFGFTLVATQFTGDMFVDSGVINSAHLDSLDFNAMSIGLVLLISIAVVFFILVSFFINAGLTGMAKEATVTGKTSLSDLWTYGKKYFLKILGLSIGLSFIMGILLLIVFFILLIIFIVLMSLLMSTGSAAGMIGASIIYLLFMFVFILAVILISAPFYFATYALVIDDCEVIESISRSWNIFAANKKEVLTFVIVIIFISIAISLVLQLLRAALLLLSIVGLIVSSVISLIVLSVMTALVALWSVRKYYSLTTENVFEETAVEFGEYSEIEQGILGSDGTVVSEEVYEETSVSDDEKRD